MYRCPVELTLDVIGGKWRVVMLAHLKEGVHTYGALRRKVPDISEKMFAQRLNELRDAGLVTRRERKPHVEYELTEEGRSLAPVLQALYDWGLPRHWEPASLSEVAELFAGYRYPWWVAGGIAIELAVGRSFREHGDIDVVVLRKDQLEVQRLLDGWELWAADPPGTLRPWRDGEVLPEDVHDVWCRPADQGPWRLQIMIDESDGDMWVSRRDPEVRRPLREVVRHGTVPYLAPEVQLYFKAARRPKDQLDFEMVWPLLDDEQRRWLYRVLPAEHPWQATN